MGKISIRTIDYHTAGEPLRIIIDGYPKTLGKTILEKRKYLLDNLDHLRTSLIFEPRGHYDMYACLPVEAERKDSDFGMIFMHNEGYSTMCGHAVIAMGTHLIKSGQIPLENFENGVKADTPAGQVLIRAIHEDDGIRIAFENVPSFVFKADQELMIDGLGLIHYDLVFGGAFYALVESHEAGIKIEPDNASEIRTQGMKIKEAIMDSVQIEHPESKDLGYLYGVIFTGPSPSGFHSQNVCVFANGEIDRSPTGTGVSARIAHHYSKSDVGLKEEIEIESIIKSSFKVKAIREIDFHGFNAVIPEVSGKAFQTGEHNFIIDPNDPLGKGFLIR